MKDKIYTMRYVCDNCGRSFVQSFEFGKRAYKGECPHCGVSPRRGTVPWEYRKDL